MKGVMVLILGLAVGLAFGQSTADKASKKTAENMNLDGTAGLFDSSKPSLFQRDDGVPDPDAVQAASNADGVIDSANFLLSPNDWKGKLVSIRGLKVIGASRSDVSRQITVTFEAPAQVGTLTLVLPQTPGSSFVLPKMGTSLFLSRVTVELVHDGFQFRPVSNFVFVVLPE